MCNRFGCANLKYSDPFIPVGAYMSKIAIIVADLVPEASETTHNQIEKEITESLQADWLLRVEKVTVLDARY
jgi:hypothetical protein